MKSATLDQNETHLSGFDSGQCFSCGKKGGHWEKRSRKVVRSGGKLQAHSNANGFIESTTYLEICTQRNRTTRSRHRIAMLTIVLLLAVERHVWKTPRNQHLG